MVQTASAFPIASALPGASAGPACPTTSPRSSVLCGSVRADAQIPAAALRSGSDPMAHSRGERRTGAAGGATKGATGSTARSVGRPLPSTHVGGPRRTARWLPAPQVRVDADGGPRRQRRAAARAECIIARSCASGAVGPSCSSGTDTAAGFGGRSLSLAYG
jgi:hypothetical protein